MATVLISMPASWLTQMRGNAPRARAVQAVASGAILLALAALTIPLPEPARPALAASALALKPQSAPIAPAATADGMAADSTTRRFTGLVGADLSKSLVAAGVPELQGREYVALMQRAFPLAGALTVDDRFDLIIERNSDGSLGQLVYAGMDRVARADIELMKWTDGRQVIWVNADETDEDSSQGMRLPVHGRVTSAFGERFHPILGYERFHAGIDLGAPAGTPIVAAADGRVVRAGWQGGYGQAVEIAHADGIETKYGHMSRIAAHDGETVRQGQVIGYVGSTGLSTGPHVHFEVMKNGRPVNPMSVKAISSRPELQGDKLLAFQDQLRRLLLASPGS